MGLFRKATTHNPHNEIVAHFFHNRSGQKSRCAYRLEEQPAGGGTAYGFAQADCWAAPAPRGWEPCQEAAETSREICGEIWHTLFKVKTILSIIYNSLSNKHTDTAPCDGNTNLHCGQNCILKLSVSLPQHMSLGHVKSHSCYCSLKDGPDLVHPTWGPHATDWVLSIFKPNVWTCVQKMNRHQDCEILGILKQRSFYPGGGLTDIVFHSSLKELIYFLSVGILLGQPDLIFEPVQPDLCTNLRLKY